MKQLIAGQLILVAMGVGFAQAEIRFVSPDQSIDIAIGLSASGDTVVLENGVHIGPITPYGRQLTIGSRYLLDADTRHIRDTIILPDEGAIDSQSCAIYAYHEPYGSRLVGLTLSGGTGTWWNHAQYFAGGGVFIDRASLSIENCVIENCRAAFGGAIAIIAVEYQWDATLRLADSRLSGCDASRFGGGVYADNCSLLVNRSIFDTLTCTNGGGGICAGLVRIQMDSSQVLRCCGNIGGIDIIEGHGVISNSLFDQNSMCGPIGECHLRVAAFYGDIVGNRFTGNRSGWPAVAISGQNSNVRFLANVLEANVTTIATGTLLTDGQTDPEVAFNVFRNNINVYGGAVYCYARSLARIHHNTFIENSSMNPEAGTVIQSMSYGRPTVTNNIIAGNMGQSIAYYPTNPVRIDARNNWWGHESGPYHLTQNPQGHGDTLWSDSVTFIPWLTSPPDTTQPSAIRPEPVIPVAGTWDLQNVFPNPFNNAFTVALAGFAGNSFNLSLYNIQGQKIATLHSGPALGGLFSFAVSAELSSGVYFLVAHDEIVQESIKVVLLK